MLLCCPDNCFAHLGIFYALHKLACSFSAYFFHVFSILSTYLLHIQVFDIMRVQFSEYILILFACYFAIKHIQVISNRFVCIFCSCAQAFCYFATCEAATSQWVSASCNLEMMLVFSFSPSSLLIPGFPVFLVLSSSCLSFFVSE